MGKLDGKVVLITGMARGQGRAHAIKVASEGANVIGVDIAGPVEISGYPPATPEDLAATVDAVQSLGQRIIAEQVDVRDRERLEAVVDAAVAELGRLDVVVANAGVFGGTGLPWEVTAEAWQTTLDVNLTGVWHTTSVSIPHVLRGNAGGSIILTASVGGVMGAPHSAHYVAAKHGVLGLMKSLANALGPDSIRVNAVLPTNVRTPMIDNEHTMRLFRPDLEHPTMEDTATEQRSLHLLPVPWIEPEDVANAVLWLASDDARYVTGTELLIDLGLVHKWGG